MKIELSVIIPTKNEGRYIERCLESVKESIKIWKGEAEIIVVDNGSTDRTAALAKRFGCKVIENVKGKIGWVRNLGAKTGLGRVLVFLDADCVVPPAWVDYCLSRFENDPSVAAIGTAIEPDFKNATWVEKAWFMLVPGADRPDYVPWLGTSNLFVMRDVFFDIGGFNASLEAGEDVDLCFRIRKKGLRIFLEKRIRVIHLRESKTLRELFLRERHRGKHGLRSFILKKCPFDELFSIAVPAVFALAIVWSIIGVWTSFLAFLSGIFIILFSPIGFIIKKRVKSDSFIEYIRIFLVAMTYILARAFAICEEFFQISIEYAFNKKR